MSEAIENMRIYKSARGLEDQVYELVKEFPATEFYRLGNDLRRSSAAVSHHIMNVHRLYSIRLKLDELAIARREVEVTQVKLESAKPYGASDELIKAYTEITKQAWGLTRWFKQRLEEKREKTEVATKEQLAASV